MSLVQLRLSSLPVPSVPGRVDYLNKSIWRDYARKMLDIVGDMNPAPPASFVEERAVVGGFMKMSALLDWDDVKPVLKSLRSHPSVANLLISELASADVAAGLAEQAWLEAMVAKDAPHAKKALSRIEAVRKQIMEAEASPLNEAAA